MSFEQTELDRRISNLIRLGTIASVDYDNARVRVQSGDILTGWIPWQTQRAGGDITWHAPEVHEQVIILSPSGELNQGVALIGIFQAVSPPPVNTAEKHHTIYKDGAVIEYDREAHHLKAVLPAGATVELIADGGIAITGDITLTGNITMTGDVAMTGTLIAAVDVLANGISLYSHDHTDSVGVPV